MLGSQLLQTCQSRNHEAYASSHQEIDLLDYSQVEAAIRNAEPEFVINCAAYTDVDNSEIYPEKAFSVNANGTGNLAKACKRLKVPLVYISSDYLFDGSKKAPYHELDRPNPLNKYGQSKLAGEKMIRERLDRYYIVRSSWLYGPRGKNFVDTILTRAEGGQPLKVVDDQVGSPTFTADLADSLLDLVESGAPYGIYHFSNQGNCSWYELAGEALKIMNINADLSPIDSTQLHRPAPRPAMSALTTLQKRFMLRNWKEALADYIREKS